MSINCENLKKHIENAFSMPFVVTSTKMDGESIYMCHPDNEGEVFFDSTVYIRNKIRIIVEIRPQRHGGELLYEISKASTDQRKRFFDYLHMLEEKHAKIQFLVNGSNLKTIEQWPETWRNLECRITKVPPTDENDDFDEFQVISEWMIHSICLMFATLTITNIEEGPSMACETGYAEGNTYQTTTIRYERNPINRELCLARKGYKCNICKFDFKEKYGQIGQHFIEVHHITPISQMGSNYKIDINRDLIPVCANCHAMLHKKNPPYMPKELEAIISATREKREMEHAKKNILMAITYSSQIKNTISSGKIAIGIKDEMLCQFTDREIDFILLHNWQNDSAQLFRVILQPRIEKKENIMSDYFLKYKDANFFLLLDIDNQKNLYKENYDILHLQPSNRKVRYDLMTTSFSELMEPNI